MESEEIKRLLVLLRAEHRALDEQIALEREAVTRDDMTLARMKKRKLRLRDEIAAFEDMIIPDIIA